MKNTYIYYYSLFVLLLLPSVALSQRSPDINLEQRDKVFTWIESNMIGKTLGNPKETLLISNDTIETTYEMSVTFGNLVKTEYGLYFDKIWVVTQTNYDVDENKERVGPPRNKDRSGVSRFELIVSRSIGELKGTTRGISNTITDIIGSATRVRASLVNDKLIFETHFTDYSDYFAKGGGFKPGGSVGTTTFGVEEGKLRRENNYVAYNLDPETLEKLGIAFEEKGKIITEK